jgi:hypothetical protein
MRRRLVAKLMQHRPPTNHCLGPIPPRHGDLSGLHSERNSGTAHILRPFYGVVGPSKLPLMAICTTKLDKNEIGGFVLGFVNDLRPPFDCLWPVSAHSCIHGMLARETNVIRIPATALVCDMLRSVEIAKGAMCPAKLDESTHGGSITKSFQYGLPPQRSLRPVSLLRCSRRLVYVS